MSILKVDAIRDNGSGFNDVVTFANSGGTQNGTLCRAWVNFNGSGTVAIRNQFNVNSIGDGGTGKFQINLANALPDQWYSVQAQVKACGVIGGLYVEVIDETNCGNPASNRTYLRTINHSGTVADSPNNHVAIFR